MAVTVNDGALQWVASVDTSQLTKEVEIITQRLNGITASVNEQAKAIDSMVKRAVAALGAYLTVTTATGFINDIIKVRGEFQQLQVAFETMLGSKVKADKLLAEIKEFAATTPFELTEVAKASKLLLAFGINAEDIKGHLRALGDVASGIGAPIGEIAFLFGQIKTQGKAMTIDIRQFAQRGIPIYEELAKVLQVSVDRVDELITAGKVGFPEIEQVFQNLTAAGSKFGGLMERQSHTLAGQISNLRDAFDQMLNEIGQSGEGIFEGVIDSLKFLVENFSSVVKIVGILITSYGSYRAAVIASTLVTKVYTVATKSLSVAQTLQATATTIASRTMAVLNKTMLLNPAFIVVTGITALITALTLFAKEAVKAKTAAELLADAQKDIGDNLADVQAKILPYQEALRKSNLSEQERLDIYTKLKAIDPDIVAGLDAKTLSYENLTKNVNKYLDSLRTQFKLEANTKAIAASIKNEQALQAEVDKLTASYGKQAQEIDDINRTGTDKRRLNDLKSGQEQLLKQIENTTAEVFKQQEATQKLGEEHITTATAGKKGQDDQAKAIKRTEAIILAEIAAEKKTRAEEATTFAQREVHTRQIRKLEAELLALTREQTKASKGLQTEENKLLSLLEKKKNAIESIQNLERDAVQSGLLDDASEIDKINERREKGLEILKETNKEIELYNKRNKANVQLLGPAEIKRINDAADTLIRNLNYRKDADDFIKALAEKEQAFADFQQVLETGNQELIKQSRDANEKQLEGFTNFIDLLQAEYERLFLSLQFAGGSDIGQLKKFQAVKELLDKIIIKTDKETKDRNKKQLEDLLKQTVSFEEQKLAIISKYDKLQATLELNEGGASPEILEDRRERLKQSKEDELRDLQNALARQSNLYKQLSLDIIGFSRQQIKQEIANLEKTLKASNLTPQMQADVQSRVDQLKGVLDSTNETAIAFDKLSKDLGQVGGSLGEAAEAVRDLNEGLADTLQALSSVVNIASKAAGAVASFASGDIVGGITQAVGVISDVIKVFGRIKKSREEALQAIADFQAEIVRGEREHQALIRERARQEAKANDQKIKGLQEENRLLQEQRAITQKTFDEIFAQLQKENFISGQRAKKKHGGLFSFLSGSEVVDELTTLAGKSFEEIEKLFTQGQLTEKAQELFEELRKARDEGLDIDRLLEENKIEAQQLLTGTTSDSITDAIVKGFQDGKRSIKDFTGDFQELMQEAMLNSLKFKYLEGPVQKLFDDFAAATETEGQLTTAEIDRLKTQYDTIIANAVNQFEQLQDIAGINFSTDQQGRGNTLTGAIKGITEQQAELLAGQFGGLRISVIEQVRQATRGVEILQNIEANTSWIKQGYDLWRRIELSGLKIQ